MTERMAYILKQSLRLKLGVWITDAELAAWIEHLARMKVVIGEKDA